MPDGEVVGRGLSMPHSPRWYRDRLWVLNSGCGEFGYIDTDSGKFEPVAFCPGSGTASGDYETTEADGGPSHVVVGGLRLGATADGDPLDDAEFTNPKSQISDFKSQIGNRWIC